MKNKNLKIIFLTTAFLFVFFVCSFITTNVVFAENEKESHLFSPNTASEYNDVSNRKNVFYSNGKIYSISDDKNIHVYYQDTSFFTSYEDFAPYKMCYYKNGQVFISASEKIYTLNLNDLSISPSPVYYKTNFDQITTKSFSYNGKYLVSISNNDINIYKTQDFSDNVFPSTSKTTLESRISGSVFLIASNDDYIFYVSNGKIYKNSFDFSESEEEIIEANPTSLIANNEYLYYVDNSFIYQYDLENKKSTKLISSEKNFELGSLGSVLDICFKDENLLIYSKFSGGSSAISEFKIEEGILLFTGFAISKGNTAFNRIGVSAFDIEKNGNIIAVIDENKITVIINGEEKTFNNYLNSGFNPTNIALGIEKLLVTSTEKYYFIDLINKEQSEAKPLQNISDAVFAFNNFYVLTNDDTNSIVYKIDQTTLEKQEVYRTENLFSNFTLDVNGKFIFSEDKIITDLVGNVFSLQDGELNGNGLAIPSGLSVENHNIKSFAMDIESKEIFFILENEEVILYSTDFDNKTISEIKIENDYKTTSDNAEDIQSLKIFNIKENVNTYNLTIDNEKNINYLGIFTEYNESKKDFVKIYSITSPYQNFVLLSGYDKNNREIIILANLNDIEEKQDIISESEEYVYISTPVDMYYLPLINTNRAFSIVDNNETLRISKNTGFSVLKQVTINGVDFYYGSATVNNKTYTGYIPKNFTVKLLSKSYIRQTFSYINVKATTLFDNNGQNIINIIDTENVKLLEEGNEKSFIEYDINGTKYFGYIFNSAIDKPENNTLKIVICLAVLSLCAFITTMYFVFIRKN